VVLCILVQEVKRDRQYTASPDRIVLDASKKIL